MLFRTVALSTLLALPASAVAHDIHWKEIRLAHDRNEGIALADVDRDGKPDLVAGGSWYQAPDWKAHPLRDLGHDKEFEFAFNNGDLTFDVDGDEWVDVISGSWMTPEIYWYRNPGKDGLAKGEKWQANPIGKMKSCEAKFLHDFDGDGLPELVLDSWEDHAPVLGYRLKRNPATAASPASISWEEVKLGESGSGHGMGIADVNGDGRADIIVMKGWYEVPTNPLAKTPWAFHPEFNLGHTSTPLAVYDFTGDGLADIVYGQGHDYKLRWLEQRKAVDGRRAWMDHMIDERISQSHTITLADLDGDLIPEVITGKRLRGHGDDDPGSHDTVGLYFYEWDAKSKTFDKHVIREAPGIKDVDDLQKRPVVGTGMKIIAHDFNGDGKLDLAVAGKGGTYVLMQEK